MDVLDNIEELEVYKLAVEKLADSSDSFVFGNSGKKHAAILMANIFRTAKTNIKMFAGDLNGDVSSDDGYLNNIEKYLKGSGNFGLVLERIPSEDSKAYKLIKSYINTGRVKISLIDRDRISESPIDINETAHFVVGDSRMYRLETDKKEYKAVASFNDKATSTILENFFNSLVQVSLPIQA